MDLPLKFAGLLDTQPSASARKARGGVAAPAPNAANSEPANTSWVRRVVAALRPLLGYLLVLLVIDAGIYTIPYAISDDYPLLMASLTKHFGDYMKLYVLGGRPVVAPLEFLAFHWLGGVADLRDLRLVGLVELAVLAWLIYRALMAAGVERRRALLIPLLICTLPAVQIYVAWAVLAMTLLGALMTGVAVLLAERALAATTARPRVLLWGAAELLLYGALALYQPSAMVFWLFAAIILFATTISFRETATRACIYLAMMLVGMAGEYLTVRFLPRLIYGPVDFPRAGLTHDPIGKMIWFTQEPLTDAFSLAVLPGSRVVAIVVATFVTVGLLLYFRGTLAERVSKLFVAAALIPLSFAPNLVVVENLVNYRTLIGPSTLVALYVALALFGFTDHWPLGKRLIAPAILGGAALVSSVAAFNIVTREVALPGFIEYQAFASILRSTQLDRATSIYVIPPDGSDGAAPFVLNDEFGLPATALPWNPPAMAYLVLHQTDPTKEHLPVVIGPPYGPSQPPKGSVVVDMHRLKDFGAGLP